ncbi:MAG: bifunctional adenosylcobinamide kinase/adenosylcobinamide-phosphate guanylyltransferase [Clostridium sp.]|nr:bifunctional adenosylcobinamide kinase/adenosylcobinamide-phosphate guanylyltransferase [Lachnoclostridium sp.]MCM1253351.1 bifunctional adenosylcobinamide kinase/adenosylcobinamide-phosphate guanylyltransferase [Clostridium sp.]
MKLIIGGYAQGKLHYVLQKYQLAEDVVWDARLLESSVSSEQTIVINHFHKWIKERLITGNSPEEEILSFLENHENCIIISDEIGNGIVPVDAFEREYRERTGRILVTLAERAEEVERVLCGIGQKIK